MYAIVFICVHMNDVYPTSSGGTYAYMSVRRLKGPVLATMMVSEVGDPHLTSSGVGGIHKVRNWPELRFHKFSET